MFGKKKDKDKDKASKIEASVSAVKSKIWGIESLNEDNFDSGFSFVVKSIKWLRKNDGALLIILPLEPYSVARTVEGIFRKSGDSVRIDHLKSQIDELDCMHPLTGMLTCSRFRI